MGDCVFSATGGALRCDWYLDLPAGAWTFLIREYETQYPLSWAWRSYGLWPDWYREPTLGSLSIPIWLLFFAVGVPTAFLWYLHRRRPTPGFCPCGYNLTGNMSGACPECGRCVEVVK
jgi:hypothetical protein